MSETKWEGFEQLDIEKPIVQLSIVGTLTIPTFGEQVISNKFDGKGDKLNFWTF